MTLRNTLRSTAAITATLALSLTLAACGSDDSDAKSGEESKTIKLGFIPSWTDGLSTAYLLENQLEKLGYDVEMQTLTDAGPLYVGLSKGDVDMFPSAWPEVTHKDYMAKFGDKIEDVGTYYEDAKLTMAVPEYSKLKSIEDLNANAAELDGRIVGIEAGAGLTGVVQDSAIPKYDLGGKFELLTSSTPAMLAELKKATASESEIVVTLWRPFWANSEFAMRDLEDPKGAMGKGEGLHFLGTKGFSEEFPEAAELIESIKLDDEQYGSLENMVVNEYGEGKEAEAVTAWLKANPDAFEGQQS